MASHKALLIIAASAMAIIVGALLPATASAWPENHVVGENKGWNLGVDYDQWVEFIDGDINAGDTLEFLYFADVHNVVMVDEDGYNTCDRTSIIQTWATGDDYVQLPNAGKFFFICGVEDHCSRGMKLAVTVV